MNSSAKKSGNDFFKFDDRNSVSEYRMDDKKEKEVFSAGEVQSLKSKIEKLDAQKLIEEALKFSKKTDDKKEKKDEFLETLKGNAVKIFLETTKNKSLREVIVEFEKKINEYNKASMLYKDKIDKEK